MISISKSNKLNPNTYNDEDILIRNAFKNTSLMKKRIHSIQNSLKLSISTLDKQFPSSWKKNPNYRFMQLSSKSVTPKERRDKQDKQKIIRERESMLKKSTVSKDLSFFEGKNNTDLNKAQEHKANKLIRKVTTINNLSKNNEYKDSFTKEIKINSIANIEDYDRKKENIILSIKEDEKENADNNILKDIQSGHLVLQDKKKSNYFNFNNCNNANNNNFDTGRSIKTSISIDSKSVKDEFIENDLANNKMSKFGRENKIHNEAITPKLMEIIKEEKLDTNLIKSNLSKKALNKINVSFQNNKYDTSLNEHTLMKESEKDIGDDEYKNLKEETKGYFNKESPLKLSHKNSTFNNNYKKLSMKHKSSNKFNKQTTTNISPLKSKNSMLSNTKNLFLKHYSRRDSDDALDVNYQSKLLKIRFDTKEKLDDYLRENDRFHRIKPDDDDNKLRWLRESSLLNTKKKNPNINNSSLNNSYLNYSGTEYNDNDIANLNDNNTLSKFSKNNINKNYSQTNLPNILNNNTNNNKNISLMPEVIDENFKKEPFYKKLTNKYKFDQSNVLNKLPTRVKNIANEYTSSVIPHYLDKYSADKTTFNFAAPNLVKKLIKADFKGPYFSHCTSCLVKNVDFYTKLNIKQSEKILDFVTPKENIIGG